MSAGEVELFGFGREVLKRLDRMIDLLETMPERLATALERRGMLSTSDTIAAPPPESMESSSLLPPTEVHKNEHRHRREEKDRRIADETYYRYAPEMVRMLLHDGPARTVGRINISLKQELGMKESTFRTMIKRITTEHDWLLVRKGASQGSFLRISDVHAAETWLAEVEAHHPEAHEHLPVHLNGA